MQLLKPIFWGIISALAALVFEIIYTIIFPRLTSGQDLFRGLTPFLFIGVVTEEFFKFIILANVSRQFTEKRQIFLNAGLIGTGFALTDSFFSIYSNDSFFAADLLQGIPGLFLIHIFTTLITGAFIARYRFRLSIGMLLWPFLAACCVHLSYNILLINNFQNGTLSLFLAASVISFGWILLLLFPKKQRFISSHRDQDLPK